MDLEPFRRINPCGYAGLQMTQVSALGGPGDVFEVARALAPALLRELRLVDDDAAVELPREFGTAPASA
jgi:lipoyl(octanoyl) transferase